MDREKVIEDNAVRGLQSAIEISGALVHLRKEHAKAILALLKSQQAEIERLKEKDRLHCEDCAYNGICETPHTDKSPLCAEYSIVR